jgi:hypothetical protein
MMPWAGEKELLRTYESFFGRKYNISNQETFTEKMFKRMIDVHKYGNPRFTEL